MASRPRPPKIGAKSKRVVGQVLTYAILLVWSFVCLFPIWWVITTSIKSPEAVLRAPTYVPWFDFEPDGRGWDSILNGDYREIVLNTATNTFVIAVSAAALAVVIGSMAGYGLTRFNYKFGPWRNRDISFWFLSQLILPPAAVVLPLLILFGNLNLKDTRLGMILLYTVINLPIVIWIMRDQFNSIPIELEQAALVDGATLFGAFWRIVLPIAAPGIVAAFILAVIFGWNEYFFNLVLTDNHAITLPRMISSQVSSAGTQWWTMAALTTTAILPLTIIGILLERYIVKGLTAGAVK